VLRGRAKVLAPLAGADTAGRVEDVEGDTQPVHVLRVERLAQLPHERVKLVELHQPVVVGVELLDDLGRLVAVGAHAHAAQRHT